MKKLLLTALGIFGFTVLSMAQLPIFTTITGQDTACISQESVYSVQTKTYENQYLFRDTIQKIQDGNGFFALNAGYNNDILKNTFSYDLWVKPTRSITISGESNVCAGGVSVPLANSNQNWAIVPVGLGGGEMSVGLTIGTNGLMVGEHSGNILVSRLSYSIPITDWVHVAIVYRTDSIFLYLNGNLVRQRITHCPSNIKRVTSGLTGYYYSPDFKGDIDEFRLWDIPLTSGQIKEIKNKKLLSKVDGLRYYASFDNGKFERTLGDIGNANMTVNVLTEERNIKNNDWILNSYTGSNINNLTAFSSGSLSYLWSTGSTSQTTVFVPTAGNNELSVTVSNSSSSEKDSIEITGINCSQPSIDTLKNTDGLVAYYPFNGNSNDESGNGNNGTPSGATLTTDRNGIANSAYQFNGTDNYIRLLRPLAIDNIFTFSFWAYNEMTGNSYGNIISDGGSQDGGNDFLLNLSGDRIGIRADKGGNSLNYEYGSPAGMSNLNLSNKWIHVVWVMNPTKSIIYLDGTQIAEINESGTNTGYHDLNSFIGARQVWGSPDTFFKGKIDDIEIYDRALTPSEVNALDDNSLVATYPFNGNANDESGNGNNGTPSGASLTTDRNGNPNSAYQFNGADNYIELIHPLPVENVFTISFWANNQMAGNSIGTIINDGSVDVGGNDFLLNMTSSRIGIRADKDNKPLNYEDSSPYELSNLQITNRWMHVAWVMTQDSSMVYLDGKLIAAINSPGTNKDYHDLTSFIGARKVWSGNPDEYFHGKIDDILIYNRALNQSEILALSGSASASYKVVLSSNPTTAGNISGSGTYMSGSQVTIKAIPAKDCSFVIWSENGKIVSTDATYSFTATANRNLVANFALPQSTITTVSNPSYSGTTYGEGIYENGTEATVSVSPKPGYSFVNWTENGISVSTNPVYTFVVDSTKALVANFLSTVGIKESNNVGIQVYPNPVSDKLHINLAKYSGLSIDEIILINSTGAVVYRIKTNDTNENIVIDIQGFKPGIYNLLLSDKEKSRVAVFKIAIIQ